MSQLKQSRSLISPYREIITFIVPLVIFLFIVISNFSSTGSSQQLSDLAQAFLHGQLNFLKPIGGLGQDPVYWHGKIYWSEGPFPAVLLMPFVGLFDLFHAFFYQGYLMCILVVGVLCLVYKLARLLSFSKEDSLLLAFGFTLGSVFIGVAAVSSSWFYAQVVNTFLIFWSLYEYFSRKQPRWWLIGIICGLILMTRATAFPIIVFFALEAFRTMGKTRRTLLTLTKLSLPPFIAGCLLALYNFLRFHNPLNEGYAYQLIYPASAAARSLGLVGLIHIPTNFYYAILSGPNPVLRTHSSWTLKYPYITNNPYGMSIFITSPYLLYVFMQKWRSFDARSRNLVVAIILSTLLVFSSYVLGLLQFGYRYSLDFLPELFLLFMILYQKKHAHLTRGMKFLLVSSGIFNFYLLWTFLA